MSRLAPHDIKGLLMAAEFKEDNDAGRGTEAAEEGISFWNKWIFCADPLCAEAGSALPMESPSHVSMRMLPRLCEPHLPGRCPSRFSSPPHHILLRTWRRHTCWHPTQQLILSGHMKTVRLAKYMGVYELSGDTINNAPIYVRRRKGTYCHRSSKTHAGKRRAPPHQH